MKKKKKEKKTQTPHSAAPREQHRRAPVSKEVTCPWRVVGGEQGCGKPRERRQCACGGWIYR
jgi:hypothetical protein